MKKNILLVCQGENLIKMLQGICHDLGYVFIVANSSKQAIKLCLEYHPDMVFINCDLLKESSVHFVKKIHALDKLMSIILLSKEDAPSLYEKYIKEGASDFIVYPIHSTDLRSRIRLHAKIRTLNKRTSHQHQMLSANKGISPSTLMTVRDFFKKNVDSYTIASAASEIGIAYQTMHRYIHHLLSAGELEVQQEYGNNGRPLNRYLFRR